MASRAARETESGGKDKRNERGISAEKWTVFFLFFFLQTTRGRGVRVGEREARESSVCDGFRWELWEGSSFVPGVLGGREGGRAGTEEWKKGAPLTREGERERGEAECKTREEIQPLCLDFFQHWKQ